MRNSSATYKIGAAFQLIPIVTTTLNSSHCRRCCVIKDHLDNNLVRCGVPNPFTDKTVDLGRLPLATAIARKYEKSMHLN
ncbi:unnamed protein product [Gongylonema pulchrum]|uniref:Secreted protein n=1 Tax=Gongylonema pulchrum TaxID=637853 RepID=A0A183EZT0_9BILA|nr:unnamed protein product [Gongylonema pulchrum]